jgi:hypothetical protein
MGESAAPNGVRRVAHRAANDFPGNVTVSHPLHCKEPTVGEIARRLNEPLHRIEYVIRSRGIQPARIAGNVRIFSEDHVARITAELRQIDGKKGGGLGS